MLKTLKKVIVIILATLGVLFIALMLMPDDEESEDTEETVVEQEVVDETESDTDVSQAESTESDTSAAEQSTEETSAEEVTADQEESTTTGSSIEQTNTSESTEQTNTSGNTVTVTIPESELSDLVLNFKTVSLDGNVVTQDIFADYDITVVHIWGTFCLPCIAEMGDYASFYKELPDNVNLVGLICDVYDGIDSNVSDANDILSNAGAEFLNLRTSDDLYDVTGSLQYVPSAFFVDREGHIIGELMDGANFSMTKERLDGYLN